MKNWVLLLGLSMLFNLAMGQNFDQEINILDVKLQDIQKQEDKVRQELEGLKLQRISQNISKNGLPKLIEGEELINHHAMSLVYSEKHEQAKWVAHIITSDILKGSVGRTNDFRVDPKVSTGSTIEQDYFLKELRADSTYEYDGFGYDRGHLAPSADFRWSKKALSESYFYSNMSPQAPEFNRGKWAELEGILRAYIAQHPTTQLQVVTGPILTDDLPSIKRSVNKVSIPKLYFKVAIDIKNERGIAFIMPNKEINYPISSFAVSIDKVEEETGLDFFHALADGVEDKLEQQKNVKEWLPKQSKGDVEPIYAPSLPKQHFNTVQAKLYANGGSIINVCGTVVSARLSSKGNVILNLDKQYPHHIFTVFIRKADILNFPYNPVEDLMGRRICLTGKVTTFAGSSAMFIRKEEDLKYYDEWD